MTKPKAIEEMNYEEAFQELEEIIEMLEAGDRPLDDTLKAFERGQALFARCSEVLDKADLQVRQLTDNIGKNNEGEEE